MADDPAEDLYDLAIDPATVFYILVKAREFDEKTAASDENPGSNSSDDGEVEILEDRPGDPTFQELMAALTNLNEDQQLDLVALTWIGRGDFEPSDWAEARRTAADMTDKHIPLYLVQTPLLSDYLESALSEGGYDLEEMGRAHL